MILTDHELDRNSFKPIIIDLDFLLIDSFLFLVTRPEEKNLKYCLAFVELISSKEISMKEISVLIARLRTDCPNT